MAFIDKYDMENLLQIRSGKSSEATAWQMVITCSAFLGMETPNTPENKADAICDTKLCYL